MHILTAALGESVKARLQELERAKANCEESLDGCKGQDLPDRESYYAGQLVQIKPEIQFLTELHLALTNTLKKPAKNPNPAPGAKPGH